ncbi:MAG: hypothetical protein ACI4UN_02845 [Muribaculaceae bacterium]
MTTVYVMATCPDCTPMIEQLAGNSNFQLVDIGEHVHNLKEFLHLRDSHPAFANVKQSGTIGIPCFVTEDGSVQFTMP